MKKLIYCAAALVTALFAGSCQRELLDPAAQGNTVTYTVNMPQVATKAVVGEADNVDNLVYAVYRVLDSSLSDEQAKAYLATKPGKFKLIYQETTPVFKDTQTGKKLAHVSLELINDQRYVVIFWAQNGERWVEANEDFRTVSYPKVLDGNNDAYDAFTNVDVISVDGSFSKDITLVRPFAQLNIATVLPGQTQNRYKDFAVSTTEVFVEGIASRFNVGAQTGETTGNVRFAAAAPLTQPFNATYPAYISMNYVFVPANQSNVKVSYDIVTNNYGTVKNTVPNVPVARNYRTNIVGNLLTSDVQYNVELAPWAENSNTGTTEVIVDGLVKNQKGDYEISNDNGMIYAINNLWVDEHGAANPATFYVYPREYNITDDQIRDIHLTSGTLKVIKDIPVMTRTIVNGIVIKGLSKPLIAKVNEGATVVISGVTIQNYEGDDQQGALVGENDGKVIIEDCAIVDETGAADETTELVGDANNNGVVAEPEFEVAGNSAVVYDAAQLAAAFAATEVDNIVLGANIAVEETLVFPEGRTATLDLKGFELKTAENMASVAALVAVNDELTITDSYGIGRITATKISAIYANHGGKLTINCNVSAHESAVRAEGGEIVISGGKYVQTGTYYSDPSTLRYTIDCRADAEGNVGKLTINGGEFVSNNGLINAGGEVTINGGKFNNDISEVAATRHMMFVNGSAIVNINGGEFYGKANAGAGGEHICVYTSKATVNIAAGKFTSLKGNGSANAIISEYSAGSAISVTCGMFNTNLGLTKYIHKDYKAVKNAETAMWNVVEKVYVAKIGEDGYESLQEAVEAVKDGETITFVADVEQVDGIVITDKNLTIDLGGKTFSVSEGTSTNNRNFKINGSSVVTIKNGTMIAAGEYSKGAYGTLRTEGSANVTLTGVTLYNYRGNGLNVKALSGTTVTINDTEIYSEYGGGVEAAGGTVELTNVKVEQKGMYTAPYNSMAISVNGGGTATVNSGTYSTVCITAEEANNQGTSHGPWCAGVLNSGGTLIINGGTFSNDNFGENTLATYARGLLLADTGANIQINGGTFNAVKSIIDIQNNLGDASKNPTATLKGGTYSSNPLTWDGLISVVNGYEVKEENGTYVVSKKPEATVNGTSYGTLREAVAAAKAGETVTVKDDVTLTEALTLPAGIIFNGNGKQINGTIYAGGDLTFAGHTKVTSFSASYYNRTITIGEGACLEVTSTGRVTLGYGNTFNITGSIEDAKTADKANIHPSLIIPGGISITGGNNAAMNVTNAYVKIGSTTSKPKAANGKFTLNFNNSIAEFTKEFGFYDPTGGKTPIFNMNIENSVYTTGTKIYLTKSSNVNVNNSIVTLGTYIHNSGELTLTNKTILTGKTIQFGENGGNDGTITIDNSNLEIIAGSKGNAFDGKGVGSIKLVNGATATIDYLKDMILDVAEGCTLNCDNKIDCRKPVADGLAKHNDKNEYYVSSAAGLEIMNQMFSKKTAGRDVVLNLTEDIDFTGKTWTPVDSHVDFGFYISEINGNGHTIRNLTINGQAMFTRFSGSGDVTVKNITFDNATIDSKGSINTSILVGHTYQNVLLDNVDVKNSTIIGGYKVAPLIATVYNESTSTITATLKNCDVENTTVKATSYDFCTTGMVAFVYAGDNDHVAFENCTVSDVKLYAPNVYTAHAAIYTTGSETLFNEAEGVTVSKVTFENI